MYRHLTRKITRIRPVFVQWKRFHHSMNGDSPVRVAIMGAAGRDFHNYLCYFKGNPRFNVVAFTATQIPGISGRVFPASLAGSDYPNGIPIVHEDSLESVIKENQVDKVVFSYSDIHHRDVMHKASRALAMGADFELLGNHKTQLISKKPVVSVVASRTGAGKSQVSRYLFSKLKNDLNKNVIAIRHPMPYADDLNTQVCQRFASYDDLDRHKCTIEEREEYEPYVDMGGVIYAGVDYGAILKEAESEGDIVIWDGGNNDSSFIKPTVQICVVDPLRPGDQNKYHPGEVNVRDSDIILINKIDSASFVDTQKLRENCWELNPNATIIECASPICADESVQSSISDPSKLKALVIDDGPTCTHGDMPYGSGYILARKLGISRENIVDPRENAVGSIVDTFKQYPHVTRVLPAMGYSESQLKDLAETINSSKADLVVSGTPINLSRVIDVKKPVIHASYSLKELDSDLVGLVMKLIGQRV